MFEEAVASCTGMYVICIWSIGPQLYAKISRKEEDRSFTHRSILIHNFTENEKEKGGGRERERDREREREREEGRGLRYRK